MKAHNFQATKCFIDDFGTLNDRSVLNNIYKDIYPPELQLKIEQFGTHATFLNLHITEKYGVFVYKLFDKHDAFSFLSFACLTMTVTSLNQYFLLLLLVNFLE